MTISPSVESTPRKPLRLWPGVVAVALQWFVRFVVPVLLPAAGMGIGILGGIAGGAVVLVWWLFFSRAPWLDRVGALVLMVAALVATWFVVHPSIANGLMGMMLPVFAVPFLTLALVASAAAGRHLPTGQRRASMAAAIIIACAGFTLIRTGGISGDAEADLHWRWTPTPEERLLEQSKDVNLDAPARGREAASAAPQAEAPETRRDAESGVAPAPSTAASAAKTTPPTARTGAIETSTDPAAHPAGLKTDVAWPGFRGPARDGSVPGVRIETDWAQKPPVELWRKPVGPGWSSFAVRGDLVYTQEQRGDDEMVSCYRLSTGEPVWRHRDAVRFWESNGGAGPRGTPTVRNGRVYTMGATGILNVLDARSGAVLWRRNAVTDTGKEIPGWGIASSPLVVNDRVIVAVAGQLAAYDAATGDSRWVGESGGGGYSSPHLATIAGAPQVLLLRGARTISVAPADGRLLWEHSSGQPSVSIVQPAVLGDGDVLIAAGDSMGGLGIRRIAVAPASAAWTVEERWASRGLKPYFNDFVVHKGHAFGFDGSILASIDLRDGARKWKGGRYGHGQLLLLPDQDMMLVLSEEGELALVSATPDKHTELARFKAIEGKTWNHPVLVGNVLLVRNGEEMAAFRLSVPGR